MEKKLEGTWDGWRRTIRSERAQGHFVGGERGFVVGGGCWVLSRREAERAACVVLQGLAGVSAVGS